MKNQNGTGSITKLKGKRRKSWTVRISYQDDTGVMRRKYLGYFETKKEAQEVLFNYNKNPLLFSGKTLFADNIQYGSKYFLEKKSEKIQYWTFKYRFRKVLRMISLQKHTIHDTRHTFATMLNNADANSTSIIKLIGHSDFSTTENVYTHKDIEELRKAINLLN